MKLKIDAKRTALLLLDVQKDLVDITPGLKENRIMENMAAVLKTARSRKTNVIHITASVRADFLDLPRDNPLWDRLVEARKSPLHQAALLGYDTLFLLLLGRLSLDEAAAALSRRLSIRAGAILCPYAEAGLDVDKPFELELMRKTLGGRHG